MTPAQPGRVSVGDEEWRRRDIYEQHLNDGDMAVAAGLSLYSWREWRRSRGLLAKRTPRPEICVQGAHFRMSQDAFDARMRIYKEGPRLHVTQAARLAGVSVEAYRAWIKAMDLPERHQRSRRSKKNARQNDVVTASKSHSNEIQMGSAEVLGVPWRSGA